MINGCVSVRMFLTYSLSVVTCILHLINTSGVYSPPSLFPAPTHLVAGGDKASCKKVSILA